MTVDGFRIDGVVDETLIEIQCASLGAIRDKVRRLLKSHRVLVVKPLAARKRLIKYKRKGGQVVSRRLSPKRESFYDLFSEQVHFLNVFPHPRLTMEILLTEQEEHRLPRLKSRWTRKNFRVADRCLSDVVDKLVLRTAADMLAMLPPSLPEVFTTQDLAREAQIPRYLAQKMAYCLRKSQAAAVVGKSGNAILYQADDSATKAA